MAQNKVSKRIITKDELYYLLWAISYANITTRVSWGTAQEQGSAHYFFNSETGDDFDMTGKWIFVYRRSDWDRPLAGYRVPEPNATLIERVEELDKYKTVDLYRIG